MLIESIYLLKEYKA